MFRRRHEYEKSSMQTVISTITSHKAKRDEAQLRVVTHEYADAMRVPEHYASTLRTRTLQSVISRMMSKCRIRQLGHATHYLRSSMLGSREACK